MLLAEHVLESPAAAREWLAKPNVALGGAIPLKYCATAHGAQAVRRLLRMLEFGGPL